MQYGEKTVSPTVLLYANDKLLYSSCPRSNLQTLPARSLSWRCTPHAVRRIRRGMRGRSLGGRGITQTGMGRFTEHVSRLLDWHAASLLTVSNAPNIIERSLSIRFWEEISHSMISTPLLSVADPSYLQRKMFWVTSAPGKRYAPCRRTHAFKIRILCCNTVIFLGCITYIRSS